MTGDLDRLEQAVERDMQWLRALPEVRPSDACLGRTLAAVTAEAARSTRHLRRLVAVRVWGGVAAALLLAVGLTWTHPATQTAPAGDPDALVAEWTAAWDESTLELTSLVDGGWINADFGQDDEAELDEYFRSLDQTLEQLEAL